MKAMVPTSFVRFEGKYSPSQYPILLEAAAKKFIKKIEYRQLEKHLSHDSTGTKITAPEIKAAVVKAVPADLLEGVLRCRASIIEGIKKDVFQEFVHKFGLKGKSADIELYVHKECLGYKIFLTFCNLRFKADQLLGVGAFDDLEKLSTDYKAFMTTFHEIWNRRIEQVKTANLTDLMEATAHEGPITLNDTETAALKELHHIYWGERGPADLAW
jgi:hypothetical protein